MNLLAVAAAAKLASELLALRRQSNPGAEAVRRFGPRLAAGTLGPGADDLAAHAIRFADQRGWLGWPLGERSVVDAAWRQLDDEHCHVCGPAYSPAGEARLVRHVLGLRSGILFVLGRRGSGKTATMCRIAELLDRETLTLGMPTNHLPAGWRELKLPTSLRRKPAKRVPEDDGEQWDEDDDEASDPFMDWLQRRLPQGSVLLVDDAGLVLDSTMNASTANRLTKYLIQVVRHVDVVLMLTGQYSSSITKYVLDSDCLLLKPPPKLWKVIERPELHALYAQLEPWWQSMPPSAHKHHVWAIADGSYEGPCHVTLPDWYSSRASKNKGAA